MVVLPEVVLPTITSIFKKYEDTVSDWRRNHLGASIVGKLCERSLWYNFRWCLKPTYSGRILRLFETGNQQESRIIQNLRDIGIEVYDRDPETGYQIKCESFGGHYSGSLDGVGLGFEEASKSWHVIELKTMNTRTFNALKKNGVEKTKPEHYFQMQQYMAWSKLERAYYIVWCKESDDLYGERIYFDKDVVKRLQSKAERVIFSNVPQYKVSDNPEYLECRFCDYKLLCHSKMLPEVNCRTCARSTPERNGTWTCSRDGSILCSAKQRDCLDCHVFIPALVPLEQTDASEKDGTIMYGNVVNGKENILSKDLWKCIDV